MNLKLPEILEYKLYRIFLSLRFYKKKLPKSPFSLLKELNESQYLDRSVTEANQLKKINSLVRSAREGTTYYRKAINGSSIDFSSLGQFNSSFKVLTKREVLKNAESIINTEKDDGYVHATSGSTGEPLIVKISGLAESYRFAGKMRFYNWWGVNFFDKSILLWKVKEKNQDFLSMIGNFKAKFKNRLDIDVFNLNDDSVGDYVKEINEFKPKYIRGYKSGVYELASLMEKYDLKIIKGSVKVVIVTSEILLDSERELIERIFECPVANEYGSAESGFYAAECERGSMHINEELVYIHTDDEDNAYVTELYNDTMPLINYRNEDQLVLSDELCSCGRTSRVIKELKGRSSDVVTCQDGTVKSAMIFSFMVREAIKKSFKKSVEQYRFIQDGDKFVLELIKGPDYEEEMSVIIKKSFHNEIGDDVSFNIKYVDKIQRDPSGKKRFFIKKNTQKKYDR